MIKNIIIINDHAYVSGGAAKVAIHSAIGLAKAGLNVVFFAAVGPIDKELLNSNVKVICLNQDEALQIRPRCKGIIQGLWNKSASKRLSALLKQYSTDNTVVHVHNFTKALTSSIFYILKKYRFNTFITLHDYFTSCPNGGYYDYKHNKICKQKALSLSCLFCNCDKRNYAFKLYRILRQIIQNIFVKKNLDLNYIYISELNFKINKNGLLPRSKFIKVTNPIELYKSGLAEKKSNRLLLYIGRLSPEKGPDLFCNAVTITNNRAVVIGDGEMKKILENKYKNIEFTGWISHQEIEKYISQACMLVFPSRCYECAPLIIIEALSAGLPCVVSDATSAVELITNNVNGYVFKSCNVNDLCQKINEMDPQKELSIKNNIQNIFKRDLYTLESHVKRLLEVYNE